MFLSSVWLAQVARCSARSSQWLTSAGVKWRIAQSVMRRLMWAHARSRTCGGEGVEQLVEAVGGLGVGGGGVDAEAEGDQVEPPVAAAGAVPVDDAGDAAVAGEEVGGLVVAVDGVVAGEGQGRAKGPAGSPA